MTLASRRLRNAAATAVAAGLLLGALEFYSWKLRPTASASGWLLLAMMVFLAAYALRKKIPVLPLGSASAWLQWHIYVGWLTAPLFTLHALYDTRRGWHAPAGPFPLVLALLYLLTFGSGLLGLFLSRELAGRLTAHGEEVLFERVPVFLRQLRQRAEELVVVAVRETNGMTLADFYKARLGAYFARPRHFGLHLLQSRRPLRRLQVEMGALNRYLDAREREIAAELATLVAKKDELDYAYALQATLKAWLVGHVALTYSLMSFVAVHVLVSYAFSGELR